MTFYKNLQNVSNSVLKKFKQGDVKLIKISEGTGPADEPTSFTETPYTLDAAVKGVTFEYVRNGFAVASDLIVTSAVLSGVEPSMNDKIEIDGVRHQIVSDMSVPAAGTKVAWKFIVRSGG